MNERIFKTFAVACIVSALVTFAASIAEALTNCAPDAWQSPIMLIPATITVCLVFAATIYVSNTDKTTALRQSHRGT